MDSPSSNFHFFPHCYGGHSARRSLRKTWRLGMRLKIVFLFFAANNGRTTVTECESFVFTCLTYRNVQRFRNGPVHEFYGLKASQMSKVHASSHEYPHVEKSRIFKKRISKVWWPTTVTAKELTSWQKEKPHGKKNNLMAEKITTTSWQKK